MIMEDDPVFYRDTRKVYPEVDRGEGIYLYDATGKKYIDATSGPVISNIGHGVTEVALAMAEQAKRVAFSPLFAFKNRAAIDLASRIVELAPPGLKRVWYSTTGAEAIEGTFKMALQYFQELGKPSKHLVISRWGSYHGATLGALSATGDTPRRRKFVSLLLPFPHIAPCYCYRCPFGQEPDGCALECARDLEKTIKQVGPEHISAFIAEPVVGSGLGAVAPPSGYFRLIREICDRYEVLFIVDEVMTGFGRTGKPFGIQHWDVLPDMLVFGKGLTSGYAPLSGILTTESIWETFNRGSGKFAHSGTMSGNPVSCAAGLAVQKFIKDHGLIEQSRVQGEYLLTQLEGLYDHKIVGDVRGKGLMIGIELVKDRRTKEPFPREAGINNLVCSKAFEKGMIMYGADGMADGERGNALMVDPPLTISTREIDDLVGILDQAIADVENDLGLD